MILFLSSEVLTALLVILVSLSATYVFYPAFSRAWQKEVIVNVEVISSGTFRFINVVVFVDAVAVVVDNERSALSLNILRERNSSDFLIHYSYKSKQRK